jgi:MFS family permease
VATTFRALRHRNYRLYFSGQLVSVIGTWMQTTALMWLAEQLTHQSKWAALILVAQMLPTFLFGAWGGILADRWPKRTLIIVTQTMYMLLAFLLAGLVYADIVVPWQLVLITAAAGLVTAADLPARLSFVNDLAGRDDLMNAVALNSLLFNVARVVGPFLAGLVLALSGAGACFLANGFSFLAVIWALFRIDVVGASRHAGHPGRRPARASLLDGFRYTLFRPGLTYLVLMAGMIGLCGWPFLALLPALSDHVLSLGAYGYSAMLSGTGIGALTAALVVAAFGSLARRRRLMAVGLSVVTAGLIGLSLSHDLWLACVFCALVGYGLILFLVTGQSVLQLSAGEGNRGRVMAVWAIVQSGTTPLGTILAGVAADRWGVPLVLGLSGTAFGTSAVLLLVGLRLWQRSQPSLMHHAASPDHLAPGLEPAE